MPDDALGAEDVCCACTAAVICANQFVSVDESNTYADWGLALSACPSERWRFAIGWGLERLAGNRSGVLSHHIH